MACELYLSKAIYKKKQNEMLFWLSSWHLFFTKDASIMLWQECKTISTSGSVNRAYFLKDSVKHISKS